MRQIISSYQSHATAESAHRGESTPAFSQLEREQVRQLQAVHTKFPEKIAAVLSGLLGQTKVALIALEEATPETFHPRYGTIAYRINFSATRSNAGIFECSPFLGLLLVDHLLGCGGGLVRNGRALSEIEEQLLHGALETLLAPYAELWKPLSSFLPHVEDTAQSYQPGEHLYVATYEISTPVGTGDFAVVLRLSQWRDTLGQCVTTKGSSQTCNAGLLDVIGDCMLPARALLGSTTIPIEELLGLRVGDIICLERDADAPVEIRIGNRPKLHGHAHVMNGQYCITIENSVIAGRA